MSSSLLGITYSEFDNILGPHLKYIYPNDSLSTSQFESFSDYVIVGKHLSNRIITIKTNEINYMNYSISIDNSKYNRNTLTFSIGFILSINIDSNIMETYENALKKISLGLVAAEIDSEFLFNQSSKQSLQSILKSLYDQLTSKGQAFIEFNQSNVLFIKLQLKSNLNIIKELLVKDKFNEDIISDYAIPYLIYNQYVLSSLPWDITLKHIVLYINSSHNIKQIANQADMDIDIVKRGVQLLYYYQCIYLSDSFRYSNVYELDRGLYDSLESNNNEIFHNIILFSIRDINFLSKTESPANVKLDSQIDCLIENKLDSQLDTHSDSKLSMNIDLMNQYITTIKQFLLCFTKRQLFKSLRQQLIAINKANNNILNRIDIRRFLAISQSLQLIHRINEYPIYNFENCFSDSLSTFSLLSIESNDKLISSNNNKHINNIKWKTIVSQCIGYRCLDDIACEFDINPSEIMNYPGIVIIYK